MKLGLSGPHLHVSHELYSLLYGDEQIPIKRYLDVPNTAFVYEPRITVRGNRGGRLSVAIIGPPREYASLALHPSHKYLLGLKELRVRQSPTTSIDETYEVALMHNDGWIQVPMTVIIEAPHVHVSADSELAGKLVKLQIGRAVLHRVPCKPGGTDTPAVHLDREFAKLLGIGPASQVSLL